MIILRLRVLSFMIINGVYLFDTLVPVWRYCLLNFSESLIISLQNWKLEAGYLSDSLYVWFQLCGSCIRLERLTMDQCRLLTSESLFAVAHNCPVLRCLSIEYDNDIGEEGICELVQKCPLLEKLHLNSCGITSQTALYIAQYCRNISVLDLRCCSSLTDGVVKELVKGCQYLQILNLSLCLCVTDISLEHIVSNCVTLRSLYLVHCKITDRGKITLRKIRKISGLHVLNFMYHTQGCQKLLATGNIAS